MDTTDPDWIADCRHWRGRVLAGKYAHRCPDWDGLPIDETTLEWSCTCASEPGAPLTIYFRPCRVCGGLIGCLGDDLTPICQECAAKQPLTAPLPMAGVEVLETFA